MRRIKQLIWNPKKGVIYKVSEKKYLARHLKSQVGGYVLLRKHTVALCTVVVYSKYEGNIFP
jgi:hypothetical protein